MISSRRKFIAAGSILTANATLSSGSGATTRRLFREEQQADEDVPITKNPLVKEVLQAGLDAARKQGAKYADVRMTHTRNRTVSVTIDGTYKRGNRAPIADAEEISVGFRALVDGYWGFSAGPVWSTEEAARLGIQAAKQARENSLGKPREMNFFPNATARIDNWVMPVEVDPFSLHPDELSDRLYGLAYYSYCRPQLGGATIQGIFLRQDKVFACTEGSFLAQRRFISGGSLIVTGGEDGKFTPWSVDGFAPAGKGLELFDDRTVRPNIDRAIEDILFHLRLPSIPIDVGRYETILDAAATSSLLRGSMGAATELDRALGYEANAGGTSYLNKPLEMLGKEVVGSKLISVYSNRDEKGGAATTGWDDEGVRPSKQMLIDKGMLSGYQSNREFSGWLQAKTGDNTVKSSGCAFSPSGVDAPLTHTGNITLVPPDTDDTFDTMIKDLKTGFAIKGLNVNMDFQQLNGIGNGNVYEVKNGRIISSVANAGVLFRAPELWKGIKQIGGRSSVGEYGGNLLKGEPSQTSTQTIYAVPVRHESLSFIDILRKA